MASKIKEIISNEINKVSIIKILKTNALIVREKDVVVRINGWAVGVDFENPEIQSKKVLPGSELEIEYIGDLEKDTLNSFKLKILPLKNK